VEIAIRSLVASDAEVLLAFFESISSDEQTVQLFHPHPFDAETARRICGRVAIEQDEYLAAFEGERVVGYAMLRGWDEGYEVPSFGVCVIPGARRAGVGRALLHEALLRAHAHGARSVMLKVYGENTSARALYESIGFLFDAAPVPGVQSVGRIALRDWMTH
jgi:ribosomal-protein-alanine N-acetyltransferase